MPFLRFFALRARLTGTYAKDSATASRGAVATSVTKLISRRDAKPQRKENGMRNYVLFSASSRPGRLERAPLPGSPGFSTAFFSSSGGLRHKMSGMFSLTPNGQVLSTPINKRRTFQLLLYNPFWCPAPVHLPSPSAKNARAFGLYRHFVLWPGLTPGRVESRRSLHIPVSSR